MADEALEDQLAKARARFAPYFYTIKDQYDLNSPYLVPAYLISAGGRTGIVPDPRGTVPTVTNAN